MRIIFSIIAALAAIFASAQTDTTKMEIVRPVVSAYWKQVRHTSRTLTSRRLNTQDFPLLSATKDVRL